MDRRRLHREVKDLAEGGYNVEYDLQKGKLKLVAFEFPTGWKPKYGELFYYIPGNYPNSVPRVYFSDGMTFRGNRSTEIHLSTGKSGYDKFCLHDIKWKPSEYTVTTLTRIVIVGLNNPDSPNQAFEEEDYI